MTTAPSILPASRSASQSLLHTITLAFANDPVSRYWWPDAGDYMQGWPRFAYAMGERGFDSGNVFSTRDFRAVSFWLPPGVDPDPAKLAALNLNPSPEDEALSKELQAGMARHYPPEPYWYLWLIGVDPAAQSLGLGSALLKHKLKAIDDAGEIAFLESSNPKNIPFYRRHGFEIVGETRVRDIPVLTSMLRPPSRTI
jgi:ribosomal protein S18 acetylase RimI-like enzyme